MIRPEHPFDIRPDLRKAETTKVETTTAETVIRPKQLVRSPSRHYATAEKKPLNTTYCTAIFTIMREPN